MQINPVKVSFNGFALLFKIPSAHCVIISNFIGGNGTGKTVMLDAFATNTANKNLDKKVFFAIHKQSVSDRPLLQLDLEAKTSV